MLLLRRKPHQSELPLQHLPYPPDLNIENPDDPPRKSGTKRFLNTCKLPSKAPEKARYYLINISLGYVFSIQQNYFSSSRPKIAVIPTPKNSNIGSISKL